MNTLICIIYNGINKIVKCLAHQLHIFMWHACIFLFSEQACCMFCNPGWSLCSDNCLIMSCY